ncbi:hypothetical protein [Williamsia phyllosphaerae]|uniref:Uncharacterized protein n=1 Tax=Williamsia phyllosphaerae TaxID=885042 RepID=A0ABQ1V6M8_9NOCA|nr:hypothetical protein [Williamsia phyllosphaerae]GGF39131.1 hypothetical protein GCM10007298_38540 [Williamsia phyllosphaerae]
MSVPEGYALAPTSSDHLVKIAVPIPGRDPILIEAPKLAWMLPSDVEQYEKFAQEHVEAANKIDAWHRDNDDLPEADRSPYPQEADDLTGASDSERSHQVMRELRLRWIKPHVKPADYKILLTSKKVPERTLQWIIDELSKPDTITAGESVASTDS